VSLFSVSVLAAHVAAYLVKRPRRAVRLAAWSLVAVCAGIVPIVVLVASADNGQLDWIPSPTLHRVAVETWDWSSRNPFSLLAAAIGIALLVVPWRRRLPSWQMTMVVCWTVAPFVLTLGLSAVQRAFDSHYLLTGAAGLALLVGAVVAALPQRASLLLAALVLGWASLELAHYYVAPGKPLSAFF
jgi:hypothetical protein